MKMKWSLSFSLSVIVLTVGITATGLGVVRGQISGGWSPDYLSENPCGITRTGPQAVCHKATANCEDAKTIIVGGARAACAHVGHGDSLGECEECGDGREASSTSAFSRRLAQRAGSRSGNAQPPRID